MVSLHGDVELGCLLVGLIMYFGSINLCKRCDFFFFFLLAKLYVVCIGLSM